MAEVVEVVLILMSNQSSMATDGEERGLVWLAAGEGWDGTCWARRRWCRRPRGPIATRLRSYRETGQLPVGGLHEGGVAVRSDKPDDASGVVDLVARQNV